MNDDTPTIEGPQGDEPRTEEAPTKAETPPPRRLLRSTSDRVIAGVAGGLGRYFDVDPVILRIAFAVSVLFGGVGLVAYGLLWLFVPTEADSDRAQGCRRARGRGLLRALAIIALVFVALGLLAGLAGVAAFAVAIGWGVPLAIAIIAIGLVLALSGSRGGIRWLIPVAVAVVVGAGVSAAADLNFRGGIGDREYHPVSAKGIPADGYRLGVGRLTVDLRDLNWAKQRVLHLNVHLGAGQANVFVPSRVCVVATTDVRAGESEVTGERNDGFGLDHSVGAGSTAAPRLLLDATVDTGQLRVINSDTASVDNPGYGPGPFHQDTAPQRRAEAKACAG